MEQDQNGSEFCNGKEIDHGFFVDENVFYYDDGPYGTEGIIIRYCPKCARDLNAEPQEVNHE